MNLFRLAWRNANENAFRKWAVMICSGLLAGFAIGATIVIGGAQRSLDLALQRLGADIIAVSEGSENLMENAYLMGVPARTWMPRDTADQIAQIPGVEAVSPQFFLSTLRGAVCCAVPEMFLIAYDPETDFTLKPWLENHLEDGLEMGEAVGGSLIFVPKDPGTILIYGYEIKLAGNLAPTGTGIDRSMFFTFETAYDIAENSTFLAVEEMEIPADSISAAMIKIEPGADIHSVALAIEEALPRVAAVESNNLFHSQRVQILSLLRSVMVLLGIAWVLFVGLIGLVFAMAVNERRQEVGVLRAIGFRQAAVFKSLIVEGIMLALPGATFGILFVIVLVYLFRNFIIQMMGVPFLIPSPLALIGLSVAALAAGLVSVVLGAIIPTLRVTRMEPAFAMRA